MLKEVSVIKDLLAHVDEKKKSRIINSSMKQFSRHPFKSVSTNVIVKEAGISKGLLYHYFGTKEKLYEYLEYFTINVLTERIVNKVNWDQPDIFMRIKEISMIKFRLFEDYPHLADFSLKIFQDKTTEEILKKYPDFPMVLYSQIYTRNIDDSLFREGVDVKRAIDIIRWTIEKCGEESRRKIIEGQIEFDYKMIEQEIYVYIDMLKDCFYRKGAH
ncbi:transcriptional regulator, TetR family [Alkalibacterium subtropicum]|uniref:Transcriptional regulator, TetR family n=1 Tax=Alkalibacterium subtropicum TaxID=753702 RepID=A0A1I1FW15_9LACT|nr:TetR/AcrR family transcriptional regulator [Alkalibacterium subtropicum]SFC01243.1 transcriptional regulator, TetR family [Alkalibacterium subtropicum]